MAKWKYFPTHVQRMMGTQAIPPNSARYRSMFSIARIHGHFLILMAMAMTQALSRLSIRLFATAKTNILLNQLLIIHSSKALDCHKVFIANIFLRKVAERTMALAYACLQIQKDSIRRNGIKNMRQTRLRTTL